MVNILTKFLRLFSKDKKILIVVGGNVNKIEAFKQPAENLGLDVTLASLSDIKYSSGSGETSLKITIGDRDVSEFDVIYIRMIGKRVEDAALLVDYAIENNIKIVDGMYEKSRVYALSLVKSLEMKKLVDSGLNLPRTVYGSLSTIQEIGERELKFPFVVKSTTGRRAREVWFVENNKQLKDLVKELSPNEKAGIKYFAQEFIKASQRVRVLTVGGKSIGAITRPTKWRKRFIEKVNGEFPEGIKESLSPIPPEYSRVAVKAAKATGLDICGVDLLIEDGTNAIYVIEANAAPAWELIKKDTAILVEEEILKFLNK